MWLMVYIQLLLLISNDIIYIPIIIVSISKVLWQNAISYQWRKNLQILQLVFMFETKICA